MTHYQYIPEEHEHDGDDYDQDPDMFDENDDPFLDEKIDRLKEARREERGI